MIESIVCIVNCCLTDQLWTAPELLRADMNLALASTVWIQKADIYSFAILLYEIFGRAGPWGDEPSEPKGIVDQRSPFVWANFEYF